MNKSVKKFLLVCMAGVLMVGLSACRKVTEGRYVETDITPETVEEIQAVFKDGDSLIAYTKDLKSVYTSTDKGNSWEQEDGPKVDGISDDAVRRLTRATDGTLLFYAWQDYDNTLVKVTPDGEMVEQPLEDYDTAIQAGEEVYVSQLEFVSEDQVLVTYYVKEYVDREEVEETIFSGADYEIVWYSGTYDVNSGQKVHIYNEYYTGNSVCSDNEKLYTMNYIGEIYGFDVATGTNIYEMPSLEESDLSDGSNTHFTLADDEDNKGYSVNGKKLQKIDLEQFKSELIIDASHYQFGSSTAILEDMLYLGAQDFIIQLSSEDGTRIYRYTYDEESEIDEKKQLHVWTLNENETVRSAVREYMAANPEASVTLEVAMADSSAMTENDALKDLNTRMLAGEGPDILLLDGSSMDTYVENELLMDLNDKIDLSDVHEPVREEYEREDGTYYFPARFSMPLLLWNDDSPKEVADFEDFLNTMIDENTEAISPDELIAIPKEERNSIRFFNIDDLFEVLWKSGQNEVVKDGEIDTGALRKLLEDAETLLAGIHSGSLNYYTIPLENRRVTFDEGPNRYLAKQAHYGAYVAEDLLSISVMEAWDSHFGSFTGLTEGVWLPSGFAAINAKTEVSDAAVEFVQLMFSDNAQAALSEGLPVTYGGAKKQQELIQKEGIETELKIDDVIGEMKTPVELELEVYNIVTDVVNRLGKKVITLDEAVNEIEEGVNKYYSEK